MIIRAEGESRGRHGDQDSRGGGPPAVTQYPVHTEPPGPRRMGAEVQGDATVFGVFSDHAQRCQVRILNEDGTPRAIHDLVPTAGGYHEGAVRGAPHGTLYEFLLDGRTLPDPYARFLPRGVHGPAMVVENRYRWSAGAGIHRPLREQTIYELHIGTFTQEGTYDAARLRFPTLVDLGVTTIEMMPLSSFAGRRGWGYDGVAHFAPFSQYGTPDELRRLIDDAHHLGLSVFLDVVYNHFGPAGNYLPSFSQNYFSSDTKNAWGTGPNFAHPAMRQYVLDNVHYWLTDFRVDGLRLDAAHAMVDHSATHILKELADLAHALTPRKFVIAEDDRNDPDLVTAMGLDGIWADDFHHVAHVTLTGETDGYYANYQPGGDELARTIGKGWLYEGQLYPTTGKARGQPAAALPREALLYCLQNHDQVGNRALGDRLPSGDDVRAYCAFSTLLLFLPTTPLLFMGQEWAASTPFQFFTDHDEDLGRQIFAGRCEEFKHFRAFLDPASRDRIPDPQLVETFLRSKLDWNERDQDPHARVLRLYKTLLRMRRSSNEARRHSSTERLTAAARRGLLVVRRTWNDAPELVLVANLSDEDVPAELVTAELDGCRMLLRSDLRDNASGPLPAWTAIVAEGHAAG
jgi:maltooligosyltrehalose trehalohydrolase